MDPISQFVQSLQKRPNIQGTILRFPAPSPLIDFFLIPIRFTLIYSFVQRFYATKQSLIDAIAGP